MIKTVSLETAKLLKEAGFKQDTYWYHYEHKRLKEEDYKECKCEGLNHDDVYYPEESWNKIAAPSTDELLEELPWHTQIYKGTDGNLGQYICHLDARSVIGQKETKWFYHKDLCEALAQMYLFLKKEGLLNDNK